VLSKIEEHVDKPIPDFAWRRERVGVVPVAPHGAAPSPDAIERAGQTAGEPVDAAAQAIAGVSFDDEMDVIRLNGEMHDAKVLAARRRKCRR
jgi:hypothetical protein